MRFEAFNFGSIRIDGVTYSHDVVIDRGRVRRGARKSCVNKVFRDDIARHEFRNVPLSFPGAGRPVGKGRQMFCLC